MSKQYKTLLLMPYFSLGSELSILGYDFVSFEKIDAYIQNTPLLLHLKSIFSMYKSPSGSIIKNPTLVTYSGEKFSNPRRKTLDKLHDIKSALIFSAFLKNNSWLFTTTENFEFINQRFNIGDDGLALSGGSIHGIRAGGLKISKTTFTTPAHIYVPTMHHSLEGEVLGSLIKCVKNKEDDPAAASVIRSLRSFSAAYRNSYEVDPASRVLGMITAFELLFGNSSRRSFRNNVLKYTEEIAATTYRYGEVNTQNSQVMRMINLTATQIWAEEFYKLRHRIIHSDIVTYDDYTFTDLNSQFNNKNNHIALSFEIYAVCLINFLRDKGFLSDYHVVITEKKNHSRTDKAFMNISSREFTLVDRGLHDLLARLT